MKEITLPLVLVLRTSLSNFSRTTHSWSPSSLLRPSPRYEFLTQTSLHHYPKEVEFFRKILMKGDFTKAS